MDRGRHIFSETHLDELNLIIDSEEFKKFKDEFPSGYIQKTLFSYLTKTWGQSLEIPRLELELPVPLKRELNELIENLSENSLLCQSPYPINVNFSQI